jgi:hypothetical protein|tara:strand:- start:1527 stop:2243 length:717 start_codon:yes stop_codon:yes gene_type:complete
MAVMTIDDALKQILTRVNDPFGDTYWLRAYQLFFEGINTLVQTGEYQAEEIPSMIKITPVETTSLGGDDTLYWSSPNAGANDLFGGFVIKIIDIRESVPYSNAQNIGWRFKEINNEYYQLLKFDDEYKPLKNEAFYMIEGKTKGTHFAGEPPSEDIFPGVEDEHKITIKFFSVTPLTSLSEIEVKYIASPIPNKFKVSAPASPTSITNPTRIDQMFSLPFIYRVIDFAVQKLSMESFD